MGALSELSSNRQSPMGNFKPNTGYRQLSYHRISDENSLPDKIRSRMTDHARKSTAATAAETLQMTTPKSKLPVRASTPTSRSSDASKDRSVASAIRKVGIVNPHIATLRRKKESSPKPQPLFQTPLEGSRYLTPPSKRLSTSVAKPLPSPPIAQVFTNTRETQSRSLIDASEKPLRRSPGTAEEEEWPTLTPAVRSLAPSTTSNSQLDRSPSSITIGKAITSAEPMPQHQRQKVSPTLGDNSAANPAAAEKPSSTTGIFGCAEPSKAEGVTAQRFITSFSRLRTVDGVTESQRPSCQSKSPMDPPESPLAALSRPGSPEDMHSMGKLPVDVSLTLKAGLGTPCIVSAQSCSKLPRVSQAGNPVSTPVKATLRLSSNRGGPLKNDPLLVSQPEASEGTSTGGAPESHSSTSGVDTGSQGNRNSKSLPDDRSHNCSRAGYPERVAPSGEAVASTLAQEVPAHESGKRIKRLSARAHAPDLGPTLTISDDAEAIIMGVQVKAGTIRTDFISPKMRRLSQDLQRGAVPNGSWKTPKEDEPQTALGNDDASQPASPASSQRPGASASLSLDKRNNNVHRSSFDVQNLERDVAGAWVSAHPRVWKLRDGKTYSTKWVQGHRTMSQNENHGLEPATLNGSETRENKRSLSSHPNTLLLGHGNLSRESIGDKDPLGPGLEHGPTCEVQGAVAYQNVPNPIPTPPLQASSPRLSPDAVHDLPATSDDKPHLAGASEASTIIDGLAVPSKENLSTDHPSRLPRYNLVATERAFSRTSRRPSGNVTSRFSLDIPRRNTHMHIADARLSPNHTKASEVLHSEESVVGLTTGTNTIEALESRNRIATECSTEELSKAPRSKSRTRLAMSKLGGLFHKRSKSSGKSTAKCEHDRKEKGGTTGISPPPFKISPGVSDPKYQAVHTQSTKLGPESRPIQQIRHKSTAHQDIEGFPVPSCHSKDVSEATAMAMAIMDKARSEKDSPQKDKLVSLAAVMVDAITNSRDAQQYMHRAQQAAKDARLSYALTQRSIAEIGRLVKESGPALDLAIFGRLQSD